MRRVVCLFFVVALSVNLLTGCATPPPTYTIVGYNKNGQPVYKEERKDPEGDIKRVVSVFLETMSAAVRDAARCSRYGAHRCHSRHSHRGRHNPALPPDYRRYGECWEDRQGGTHCR